MQKNFDFIPITSEFIKTEEELNRIVGNYFSTLENIGGSRINLDDSKNTMSLFIIVVTGGTEGQIIQLINERRKEFLNESVYLIAHPFNNSLPASLETLARLQQDGIDGQIIYFNSPDDADGINKINSIVAGNSVAEQLSRTKIGLVGKPSDWLVASSPSPELVKSTWGPEVVELDIDEVMKIVSELTDAEISEMLTSLTENANTIVEPNSDDLKNNVKVYLALKRITEKHKLDAITIRCFDLVLDIKTTGCFGLAQLNDDGYIAGCEGDLISTIGMLWTYKMTNKIPWMANPSQLNSSENSLWLAHCTVPRSLVKNYEVRSHFESGLGVGIQGYFPNGPVTLLRLGGKNIDKIWLAEGDIINTGNSENLCRTQIEIKLSSGHVNELLTEPLGNHITMISGHHANILKVWWNNFIC